MLRKPWPFLFLAIFYAFVPVIAMYLYASQAQLGFFQAFAVFAKKQPWFRVTEYFVLYPLAAAAIYSVRGWSYPALLALWGLIVMATIQTGLSPALKAAVPSEVLFSFLNICTATYLVLPTVRALYLDNRYRWWETETRYRIGAEGWLHSETSGSALCTVSDISTGGALVECVGHELNRLARVRVKFSLLGNELELSGRVVHVRSTGSRQLAGLRFEAADAQRVRAMRTHFTTLRMLRTPTYPERRPALSDLADWAMTLIETGDGIVPKLPRLSRENSTRS